MSDLVEQYLTSPQIDFIIDFEVIKMANKIVKYHNDFNQLSLRNFTAQELDLLMALFVITKEQDTKKIVLTFEQIKGISKYKPTANSRFVNDLVRMNKKLAALNFTAVSEDNRYIDTFVLFNSFRIDKEKLTLTVAVNEQFKWVINSLTSNFTRFELDEFIKLKSQYAKAAYRFLKQFRGTGIAIIDILKFRELMDIPKSYQMRDITKYVLNPIQEELNPIFKELKVKKQTRGRGGKVVGLEFFFKIEGTKQKEIDYQKKRDDFIKNKKAERDKYIEGNQEHTVQYIFPDIYDML